MNLHDPRYHKTLVTDMLHFLDSYLNLPTIAYFVKLHAVIFVDPYTERCRQRMLRRSTGGDAHRGRLYMYPIIQCMAYYCVGRMFGWRIYCVPYNSFGEIDSDKFKIIASELSAYFNYAKDKDRRPITLPVDSFERPSNYKLTDDRVAQSFGIFK